MKTALLNYYYSIFNLRLFDEDAFKAIVRGLPVV